MMLVDDDRSYRFDTIMPKAIIILTLYSSRLSLSFYDLTYKYVCTLYLMSLPSSISQSLHLTSGAMHYDPRRR